MPPSLFHSHSVAGFAGCVGTWTEFKAMSQTVLVLPPKTALLLPIVGVLTRKLHLLKFKYLLTNLLLRDFDTFDDEIHCGFESIEYL